MSDLDQNIKDFFQKKIGEYEAPVDPAAWPAIQSGISAGAGSSAAGAGGIATLLKVSVASIFAIAMAVVAGNVFTEDEQTPVAEQTQSQAEVEQEETSPPTIPKNTQETATEENPIAEANPSRNIIEPIQSEESIAEAKQPEETLDQPVQSNSTMGRDASVGTTQQERSNANSTTGMMGSATGTSGVLETSEYAPLKGSFSATQDAFDYLSFRFSADEEAHAYFWEVDGKTFMDAAFDYEFEQAGEYPVQLTVTDRIGKTSKHRTMVQVKEKSELVIPTIFTPNGDDKNASFDVERASTGIEVVNILIFNMSGELVFEGNEFSKSWDGILPNSDRAPEGKYTVQLRVKETNGKEYNTSELITLRR